MNFGSFFLEVVKPRLYQPSTWIGLLSAATTLATSGLSSLPTVLGPLLVSLGLIAANA